MTDSPSVGIAETKNEPTDSVKRRGLKDEQLPFVKKKERRGRSNSWGAASCSNNEKIGTKSEEKLEGDIAK